MRWAHYVLMISGLTSILGLLLTIDWVWKSSDPICRVHSLIKVLILWCSWERLRNMFVSIITTCINKCSLRRQRKLSKSKQSEFHRCFIRSELTALEFCQTLWTSFTGLSGSRLITSAKSSCSMTQSKICFSERLGCLWETKRSMVGCTHITGLKSLQNSWASWQKTRTILRQLVSVLLKSETRWVSSDWSRTHPLKTTKTFSSLFLSSLMITSSKMLHTILTSVVKSSSLSRCLTRVSDLCRSKAKMQTTISGLLSRTMKDSQTKMRPTCHSKTSMLWYLLSRFLTLIISRAVVKNFRRRTIRTLLSQMMVSHWVLFTSWGSLVSKTNSTAWTGLTQLQKS